MERFVRATTRSLSYARSHPEEVRRVVVKFTKIPAPVRRQITLPSWNPKIDRNGIELLDRLDVKYGLYESRWISTS